MVTLGLLVVLLLGLAAEFLNGATDAGNAIATVVSTRVLRPGVAVVLAAALNAAGAFAGTAVALTIAKGFIDPSAHVPLYGIGAAMTAILVWGSFAWWLGLPISKSHALVSGLTGAGLAVAGMDALLLDGWRKVGLGLLFSTFLGFGFGHAFVVTVSWICRRWRPRSVRAVFGRLQLVSASYMAFEHGRNDGQKFIGVIALTLVLQMAGERAFRVTDPGDTSLAAGAMVSAVEAESAARTVAPQGRKPQVELLPPEMPWWGIRLTVTDPGDSRLGLSVGAEITPLEMRHAVLTVPEAGARPQAEPIVPAWVILVCSITMGIGTSMGGWRIIRTMGLRIVKLEPYHGFSAETAAATAIGIASELAIPLSTTHTISTAIMGVGSARRLSAVRWGVAGEIVSAWVLTFPACFCLGYGIAWIFGHLR
jgi:phosphate/sulfate permease